MNKLNSAKFSIIDGDNICEVNERLLRAAAVFSHSQTKEIPSIFVIVPDRFTLQAEKIITGFVPNLLGVRVVTFSMLFNILHSESDVKVLDKTSAVLFMWKAIQSVKGELVYFGNSSDQYAFSEKMFNTVNQLTSCNADFETLEKNAKSNVTKRKMHDISIIQSMYKELTKGYIDGAGMLDWLINNAVKSEIVKNAHVYMTGFEYLSVQREEVMRKLIAVAKSFTIGVQTDGELMKVLNEIRFAM